MFIRFLLHIRPHEAFVYGRRDAGTTNCFNDSSLAYGDVEYKADGYDDVLVKEISETTDFITERTIEASKESDNQEIQATIAGKLLDVYSPLYPR